MKAKHFVLVAGNIGTGKTSLTDKLGKELGWATAYESVVDNPYLADFYKDMNKWSFHLNVFFLGHRAQQHLNLAEMKQSSIIDRSIYEDAEIFARASQVLGNISDRDFETYQTVFSMVVGNLPVPDLLIFLYAPVEVLLDRIHSRGREMEKGMPREYLELLDSLYEDWLKRFDLCPVLTIRSDNLDFVNRPEHLQIIIKRINERLSGKEEIHFPES
jgi:deoxyadenosine/deoxycytidine kinase